RIRPLKRTSVYPCCLGAAMPRLFRAVRTAVTLRPVRIATSLSGTLPSRRRSAAVQPALESPTGLCSRRGMLALLVRGLLLARGEPSPVAGVLADAQQLPPRLDGTRRPPRRLRNSLIRHGPEQRRIEVPLGGSASLAEVAVSPQPQAFDELG